MIVTEEMLAPYRTKGEPLPMVRGSNPFFLRGVLPPE